jgi:intracellular septation protein
MNPQLRRSLVDFGPLVLFFVAYKVFDLYAATATVMAAAVAAVLLGYIFDRKLHPVPLATAVIVVVFGGLTLYLNDKTFIKLKPTMIYGLFAATLLGGLVFNRLFVKYIFGAAVSLADDKWRILTVRFGGFFIGMAILNELIWRNFSEAFWVSYHVFGAIALTLIFSISQVPFLLKHQVVHDSAHDGE